MRERGREGGWGTEGGGEEREREREREKIHTLYTLKCTVSFVSLYTSCIDNCMCK